MLIIGATVFFLKIVLIVVTASSLLVAAAWSRAFIFVAFETTEVARTFAFVSSALNLHKQAKNKHKVRVSGRIRRHTRQHVSRPSWLLGSAESAL